MGPNDTQVHKPGKYFFCLINIDNWETMEASRHPFASKEQKKIKEKERQREGLLRIRDGEKYKMREMLSLYTCLYY